MLFDETLKVRDQRLPIFRRHFGIEEDAAIFLRDFQGFLKGSMIKAKDNIGIHLDEAAVAIPSKARIARNLRQTRNSCIVQAEVQNRIHHARHGDTRARPHRHQQRIGRIAKAFPRDRLNMHNTLGHFRPNVVRKALPLRIVKRAHLGRDRKAGRHRQADRGHAIQIGTLAAQQILVAACPRVPVRNTPAKAVDKLSRASSIWVGSCRYRAGRQITLQFSKNQQPDAPHRGTGPASQVGRPVLQGLHHSP